MPNDHSNQLIRTSRSYMIRVSYRILPDYLLLFADLWYLLSSNILFSHAHIRKHQGIYNPVMSYCHKSTTEGNKVINILYYHIHITKHSLIYSYVLCTLTLAPPLFCSSVIIALVSSSSLIVKA